MIAGLPCKGKKRIRGSKKKAIGQGGTARRSDDWSYVREKSTSAASAAEPWEQDP